MQVGPAEFRAGMAAMPAPVTVVTALDPAGTPVGLTASAVCSLSLVPPLLLVCVNREARSHRALCSASHFVVSVLAVDQADLAIRFATSGADKFGAGTVGAGESGLPEVLDAAAWYRCRRYARHEAGDHSILVGLVEAVRTVSREPLVHCGRAFRRLQPQLVEALARS